MTGSVNHQGNLGTGALRMRPALEIIRLKDQGQNARLELNATHHQGLSGPHKTPILCFFDLKDAKERILRCRIHVPTVIRLWGG